MSWERPCSSNEYVMGAPLFKKATVNLENGKKIVINAPTNNAANRYINHMKFNGMDYTKNRLSHEELMKGAVINIEMSAHPNKQRGTQKEDLPYSFSNQ